MDTRTSLILLLIATLLIHLAEEIRTGFRKRLPVGEMPLPLFVGINIVIYAFCFTTLALSAQGNPLAIPLAWILAVAMLLNGLGHIGIMVVRRRYFPGGVTAFVLLLLSGYLISHLMAA